MTTELLLELTNRNGCSPRHLDTMNVVTAGGQQVMAQDGSYKAKPDIQKIYGEASQASL
jgi:hypothetical protein